MFVEKFLRYESRDNQIYFDKDIEQNEPSLGENRKNPLTIDKERENIFYFHWLNIEQNVNSELGFFQRKIHFCSEKRKKILCNESVEIDRRNNHLGTFLDGFFQ